MNVNFLEQSNDISDDLLAWPSNRQQAATPLAPGRLGRRPRPPLDSAIVKDPRPDITAGLRHTTIVEALLQRGLNPEVAEELLQLLQQRKLLYSEVLIHAIPIRFPPLVVEGKSYGTGKPILDAENQASVSGSCMINLQHQLSDLTIRVPGSSYQSKAPLAFSICTEGPIIALWMHYSQLERGFRTFNMRLLDICQVTLPGRVTEFLLLLERVMNWASIDFMDEIAEQLALIANAALAQDTDR